MMGIYATIILLSSFQKPGDSSTCGDGTARGRCLNGYLVGFYTCEYRRPGHLRSVKVSSFSHLFTASLLQRIARVGPSGSRRTVAMKSDDATVLAHAKTHEPMARGGVAMVLSSY